MNSNNPHNAVFSSPLPILVVLLVIILAFAGKLNAGQKSTEADNESVPVLQASADGTVSSHQETDAGHYERYYRTLINDPADDREKLVELRYAKDGRLTEVLIDDRVLTRAERKRNEKIIRKAIAEEKKVEIEIDAMIEGLGLAMEETMGVISDLFVSGFEEKHDPEVSKADSSMGNNMPEVRRKDRKARLTTLEELESGPVK